MLPAGLEGHGGASGGGASASLLPRGARGGRGEAGGGLPGVAGGRFRSQLSRACQKCEVAFPLLARHGGLSGAPGGPAGFGLGVQIEVGRLRGAAGAQGRSARRRGSSRFLVAGRTSGICGRIFDGKIDLNGQKEEGGSRAEGVIGGVPRAKRGKSGKKVHARHSQIECGCFSLFGPSKGDAVDPLPGIETTFKCTLHNALCALHRYLHRVLHRYLYIYILIYLCIDIYIYVRI